MTLLPEPQAPRRKLPRLWAAAATYFAGSVGLQAINFLAQPLFANLMPPSDVAYIAVFLFWSTLFGLIISMQVGSSLNNVVSAYGAADVRDHLSSYVSGFTAIAVLIGLVAALAPQEWIGPTGLSRPYLVAAVAAGWCTAVVNSAISEAVALARPAAYLRLSAGVVVGGVVLGIILVLLLPEQRALGRILGYVLASFGVAAVFLLGLRWRPSYRIRRHLVFAVAITAPLLLHEILSLLINQSNRIFLLNSVGAEQTGVFTFAWSMGAIVALAGAALNNAWLPWYFRQLDAGNEQEVTRQGRRVIWLIGLATAILALASPEVLRLVGSAYAGGAKLIPFAVTFGLLTFLFNYAGNYVIYRRRTRLLLFASVPAAALNISLNVLIIPLYGVMGAVIATAVASLLLTAVAVGMNLLVLGSRHLPIGSLLAVVVIAGLALLATELLLDTWALRWSLAAVLGLATAGFGMRYWPSAMRGRATR